MVGRTKKGKKWARREKKTFWAEDESRECVRAASSLIQGLGIFLQAGTSAGALEQRKESWTSPSISISHESHSTAAPGVWAWGLWRDGHDSSPKHEQSFFWWERSSAGCSHTVIYLSKTHEDFLIAKMC